MIVLRPELRRFAEAMELKLRKHDADKGETWRWCAIGRPGLRAGLDQELAEMDANMDPEEAVDAANFLLFLFNRYSEIRALTAGSR